MRRMTIAASALVVGAALMLTAPGLLMGQTEALQTGQAVPEFTLPDTHGNDHSISQYAGKYVVLEWLNYGCPYVKKHYESGNMPMLQEKYGEKGVVWLSIVSSAPGNQGYYEAEEMNTVSAEQGNKAAAVLLDPSGTVGRLYGALVTPHMMVINPESVLIYNGAIDDQPGARASSLEGAHNYVAAALDESMSGGEVTVALTKPYG
jgi:peroxiredoxin